VPDLGAEVHLGAARLMACARCADGTPVRLGVSILSSTPVEETHTNFLLDACRENKHKYSQAPLIFAYASLRDLRLSEGPGGGAALAFDLPWPEARKLVYHLRFADRPPKDHAARAGACFCYLED